MTKISIRKNDKRLKAFVQDVTETLLEGKRHQTPGLGTFSTCTRKAAPGRAACKMAMFRASNELRDYASGGSKPEVSGPHAEIIQLIIDGMHNEEGIVLAKFGRMAIVPESGKKPKIIFHATEELNELLSVD